jgi:hypothetical protein
VGFFFPIFNDLPLTVRSLGSSRLVVLGGLAELFSGAISMGLGAFLAADSERAKYAAEQKREIYEVENYPNIEKQEIYGILEKYNIPHHCLTPVVDTLTADDNKDQWIQVCSSRCGRNLQQNQANAPSS